MGFDDKSPKQFNYIVKSPLAELGLCATTLCHQDSFPSSGNPYSVKGANDSDCATRLCHQIVEASEKAFLDDRLQSLIQPRRKALNDDAKPIAQSRPKTVGLTIRGNTFYVKWKVPKRLQPTLGKSHFVKSLRTKNVHDARRLLRAAGWEFETMLRQAEGNALATSPEPLLKPSQGLLSAMPKSKQKTFEQVFELFVSDPTRKRTKKTVSGYRDGIEIIYAVIGKQTLIGDIDRETCRKLLETLQWLPANRLSQGKDADISPADALTLYRSLQAEQEYELAARLLIDLLEGN